MATSCALLNTAESSAYLNLSRITLMRMRKASTGPAYLRLGHRIFYRQSDLNAWISKSAQATSDMKPEVL